MEEGLSYDRMITHHRARGNIKPAPPSTLTFAYDDIRYDKMIRQLKDDDLIVKVKVLKEVNEDFHQSYTIIQALQEHLVEVLIILLKDPSDEVRELSTRALAQVSHFKDGRRFFADEGRIYQMYSMFDDAIDQVRRNAYNSLLALSTERLGCELVAVSGVIPVLVEKLLMEKTIDILQQDLRLIKQLLTVTQGQTTALETELISRLRHLLSSTNVVTRRLAADNLASISFSYPGKKHIIRHQCVIPLARLMFDEDSEVRTKALLALASLSIEKKAKVALINGGFLEIISELLTDPSSQSRLNAVQLISNVGEHPTAKEEFCKSLDLLHQMSEEDENEDVRKFARISIEVLTWKP
mmetsp:Transcript_20267/g.37848  ORF Transcript_20267/g.37848 Transcript_20267/m.37848 type:complete len:354 (-) Transcript_20267:4556-5617(-)